MKYDINFMINENAYMSPLYCGIYTDNAVRCLYTLACVQEQLFANVATTFGRHTFLLYVPVTLKNLQQFCIVPTKHRRIAGRPFAARILDTILPRKSRGE